MFSAALGAVRELHVFGGTGVFFAALDISGQCNPLLCEEGCLRHQENFGEAHLSPADGVVAHKSRFGVDDHPGRCRGHPSSRGGDYYGTANYQLIHT